MEVTVAKSAGFCFGVKRAVDTVYREIESGEKPVYTFGPIIHNEQVVEDLENRGVQVIHSEDELEGLSGGTVVIRSHGVSRDVCEKIEARGMKIVDATCPFVKKIHRIVDEEGRKGCHVVIIRRCRASWDGRAARLPWCIPPKKRKVLCPKMENQYLLWHRRHLITTNLKI